MGILSWFFNTNPEFAGVYRIRNRKNGKAYIGSTQRAIRVRVEEHLEQLATNTHHNRLLQADWNAYGSGAFVLEVMENTSPALAQERELYWQRRISQGNSYVLQMARPIRRLKKGCFMPSDIEYTNAMYPARIIYVLAWAMYGDGSFVWDEERISVLFAQRKVDEEETRKIISPLVASTRNKPQPPMMHVTHDWIIKLLALQQVRPHTIISIPQDIDP